jgi:transcriptional regulator with XRE-family HTH domain
MQNSVPEHCSVCQGLFLIKKSKRAKPDPVLAKLMAKAREKSGLSQEHVAQQSGLSVRAIGHYEQCSRSVDWPVLALIIPLMTESEQAPLARYLPRHAWRFVKWGAVFADGLDTPDIIMEALHVGPPVSSPPALLQSDLPAVSQTLSAQEVHQSEHPARRHRKRKSRRSKAS